MILVIGPVQLALLALFRNVVLGIHFPQRPMGVTFIVTNKCIVID